MAAVRPNLQQIFDLRNGTQLILSKITLLTASDTVTVPKLANTTASASSRQVRDAGEAAATVTDDGANTITVVGTAGNTVNLVSLHRNVNFGDED